MRPRIQFQENMRGGATELERSLGRDGLDVGDAANAIRSKNLSVVAHPANSTSRYGIRKPETVAMMKSPGWAMLYFGRFFAARACSRTFRPCASISFNLRCKVRRLIPNWVAAAVMFPPVEASAWVISRFSVSAKSSGFAVSEIEIAPAEVPAASRSARGKSRTVTLGPLAITTPCSKLRCAICRARSEEHTSELQS